MRKYKRRKYKKRRKYFKFKWNKDDFNVNSKYVWISFLLILFLTGIIYLGKTIYDSDLFRVKKIKAQEYLTNSINNKIMGQSLFTLDIRKIYAELVKVYPECKNIHVRKEFPDSLNVEMEKRVPFIQIRKEKFYPVDDGAIILSEGDDEPIEGVVSADLGGYDKPLKKGDRYIDKRIDYVFSLMKVLKSEQFFDGFSVELINAAHPEAMYFVVSDNNDNTSNQVEVIVGKDNFKRKLYLFDNVLKERLQGTLSEVKYIDLRYNKVYLGYKR
ncbi:MAG: FtsQ-type POTRA domain-containing protein [Candidatus Omnitrophota bacterium]|nr:FtsQ-type POTRA domain-containing protein [Candidatus Omnitrophota bacterium]